MSCTKETRSANGASRYNDLLRNVRGISNTMLSKTLHEMETDGLVRRTEYLEVPVRVEYELTEKAQKLLRWKEKCPLRLRTGD